MSRYTGTVPTFVPSRTQVSRSAKPLRTCGRGLGMATSWSLSGRCLPRRKRSAAARCASIVQRRPRTLCMAARLRIANAALGMTSTSELISSLCAPLPTENSGDSTFATTKPGFAAPAQRANSNELRLTREMLVSEEVAAVIPGTSAAVRLIERAYASARAVGVRAPTATATSGWELEPAVPQPRSRQPARTEAQLETVSRGTRMLARSAARYRCVRAQAPSPRFGRSPLSCPATCLASSTSP